VTIVPEKINKMQIYFYIIINILKKLIVHRSKCGNGAKEARVNRFCILRWRAGQVRLFALITTYKQRDLSR